MKNVRSLLLALPLVGLALTAVPTEAHACGGCFVPPEENTQVTGHRMIYSLSMTQTTLYDQIEYVGAPESFSWVLPIHGTVDVGLSSDALFAFLGSDTSVQVLAPQLNCPQPPDGCYDYAEGDGDGAGVGGGGGGSAGGNVDVLVQEVVGPYETVQLQASDPLALQTWLSDHGYAVPDDIKPTIDAYQNEGFGFLAMKLVPGQGIQAMKPVRITTQGAGLALPLRMVGAGTGVLTPISLWVMAEGRYQAQNFQNMEVNPLQVLFHWDDYTSNYDVLVKNLLASTEGQAWITQHSEPYNKYDLQSRIQQVIDFNPGTTGYGDPDNNISELDDANADLDILFTGLKEDSIWVTRMHAQLSRDALANDLNLEAEPTQNKVSRYIQTTNADGTPPECPDYSWCYDDGTNGGGFNGLGGDKDFVKGKGSCAVQTPGSSNNVAGLFAALGLAAAAVTLRRRRK
jgi:MYXO-CTERM domain-containing protein